MPSIFIAERLLTGGSSAIMALPDWQSGENAKNYTEFSCYHLAKAHIRQTQVRASQYYRKSVLSSPITYPTLAHHCTGHPVLSECFIAQILTYRTPKRCNAPLQWEWILWLEKPKPSRQSRLFIDRSRQKPTEAQKTHRKCPMHFVHLTPNEQRYLGNKFN